MKKKVYCYNQFLHIGYRVFLHFITLYVLYQGEYCYLLANWQTLNLILSPTNNAKKINRVKKQTKILKLVCIYRNVSSNVFFSFATPLIERERERECVCVWFSCIKMLCLHLKAGLRWFFLS